MELFKKYFTTNLKLFTIRRIIIVLASLLVAILIFKAGIAVGVHKANFEKSWGEHYAQNFGPRRKAPLGNRSDEFQNAHGTIGKIISLSTPTVIVEGRDGVEKSILVSAVTQIKQRKDSLHSTDLTLGQFIVVIGDPNEQGQIDAKFIRILPNPPQEMIRENNTDLMGKEKQ